jgi:hypothetical protein
MNDVLGVGLWFFPAHGRSQRTRTRSEEVRNEEARNEEARNEEETKNEENPQARGNESKTPRREGEFEAFEDGRNLENKNSGDGAKPPRPEKPSYEHGQSDGGPGVWGPPSTPRTSATTQRGAAFQERITGAPPGTEYKVPLARRESGNVDFDGYDPARNTLLDAKDWNNWPPSKPPFLRDSAIDGILGEARDQIDAANGTPIEWHFSNAEKAAEVRDIFADHGITGIDVIPPE